MIRRLLLTSVALAACSASAFAADLPSRRAPPVYIPPPIPVFSWAGPYIGINAGYTFSDDETYGLLANDARARARMGFAGTTAGSALGVPGTFQTKGNGFTGGGQIGYNYELGGAGVPFIPGFGLGTGGGLVVGVEADAAYLDDRQAGQFIATNVTGTNFRTRQDYLGTVRGRLGVAFGTLLVYGTGGFAYGGVRNSVQVFNANATTAYAGNSDTMRTGYAAGGGVEYAIPTGSFVNVFNAGAVTLKAEYLHYDLGTSGLIVSGANGSSYTGRVKTEGNLVRAGLNYKLNFAPAPVVARY